MKRSDICMDTNAVTSSVMLCYVMLCYRHSNDMIFIT